MDADHLLTVGQYIPEDGPFFGWGVQLSIFDVSDFANPKLTDNVVLGAEGGASSEALYNPKAFTYFTERGLVGLPVSIYDNDIWFLEDEMPGGDGVLVDFGGTDDGWETFEDEGEDEGVPAESDTAPEPDPDEPIDMVPPFVPETFDGLVVYSVSAEEGFTELGRISTHFGEAGYYWASFTRGVFIGDDVFAVTNHGVRGAPLSDVESVPYELKLDSATSTDELEPVGVGEVLPEP
ncbi:MAG: beta-propeller domain-containing protein, partial [Phycisphaerae bacterium]